VKQKDMALIIIIVVISGIISLVISRLLFTAPAATRQVDVVQSIDPSFPTPNTTYFNAQSIDPTQLIQISNANNSNPFNGAQ
jgi:hypothetical protein